MKRIKFFLVKAIYNILSFVTPSLFKKIYFRKIDKLSWTSVKGSKKEPELLYLKHLLSNFENKIFVDVGANNGEYVFMALKYINPTQLYAFEPIPELHRKLRRLFSINTLSSYALSDKVGEAKFKIPYLDYNNIIFRGNANATLELKYVTPGEISNKNVILDVKLTSLDKFFSNENQKIGFIKVDVEGHERSVIEGGVKIIGRDNPILLIEIEQRFHQVDIRQIFKEVLSLGYQGYFFDFEKSKMVDISEFEDYMQDIKYLGEWGYTNNFLFVPLIDDLNNNTIKAINCDIQKFHL